MYWTHACEVICAFVLFIVVIFLFVQRFRSFCIRNYDELCLTVITSSYFTMIILRNYCQCSNCQCSNSDDHNFNRNRHQISDGESAVIPHSQFAAVMTPILFRLFSTFLQVITTPLSAAAASSFNSSQALHSASELFPIFVQSYLACILVMQWQHWSSSIRSSQRNCPPIVHL